MYVVDDVNEAYEIVEEVVKFAGDLSRYLNKDIAKYKTLLVQRIFIKYPLYWVIITK